MKFIRTHFITLFVVLAFAGIISADIITGVRTIWRTQVVGQAATSAGSVLSAVTDDGVGSQTVTTGINPLTVHSRISATAGGTAADIKAASVVITGTDPNGTTITETLPAFDVNTAGTKTGVKIFKTVTSIEIPAHDGTGATTSVEQGGSPAVADADGIIAAVTDGGGTNTITTGASINHLDVPRNVTATSGGTAGDIGAVQVVVTGKNVEDVTITETLPVFTENSATTVTGAKIFKEITQAVFPAHDGGTATTSLGFGNKIGIPYRLKRNTLRNTYLANAQKSTGTSTGHTVTTDATNIESNGITLDAALDSTQLILEWAETPE